MVFYFPLHSEAHQPLYVALNDKITSSIFLIDSQSSEVVMQSVQEINQCFSNAVACIHSGFERCWINPLQRSYTNLIHEYNRSKCKDSPSGGNFDMIRGMEYSLQLVESCIESSYLPLYENFLKEGNAPLNDSLFKVWRKLKHSIEEQKINSGILDQNASSHGLEQNGNFITSQGISHDVQSGVDYAGIRVEGSSKSFVPVSDRYKRDFKRDCMPPLNLEDHALGILERYEAKLAHVSPANLMHLVVSEEDFCDGN